MTRKTKEAFATAADSTHLHDMVVTGRHVSVTEAMKSYAREKVSKIERFNTRIIDVHVTMDIQKLRHIVDIDLKVNDFRLKAQAVSDNMYASIDKAIDKVQAQLRRYKDKLYCHQAKGLKAVDMNVNVLSPFSNADVAAFNDQIEEETQRQIEEELAPHHIVNRETRSLKTLTCGEAVMKMDLSGDLFLVYRSEEDRKIKVIYRRKDANYGVIEPE